MARVTVEDCVLQVPNRFELVMLAAQRAREISAGSGLTVDRDNDKNPVVALREIADETIDRSALETSLISSLQRHVDVDEPEEEDLSETALLSAGMAEESGVVGGTSTSRRDEEVSGQSDMEE